MWQLTKRRTGNSILEANRFGDRSQNGRVVMERSMDPTLTERIKSAAERLSRSSKTIALTGAGISKESGIPTFRDSEGLWEKYRPEELASREGFLSNPPLVWRWYRQRLLAAGQKEPNPGHLALADMEDILPSFLLITQNVDNLHRRAGSRELVELHGNINRYRCFDNAHPVENDPGWGDEPPRCHCGSLIRPDVVWFGEPPAGGRTRMRFQ